MSATHVIDLRSDTVTRPTPAMREAMARAEVGDDVYGEDPSVNRLQELGAALLGKEAALFVPSGTMANQLALLVHCRRGDEVIVGEGAHNMFYESGAAGAIAGVQFAVAGRGGLFTAAEMEALVRPNAYHFPPSRLVCVENTHNRAGGVIWPEAQVAEVAEAARRRGLALHLDGARVFNAAVASGRSVRELAAPFHTASFCMSKGLGAPVGSVIGGPRDFIVEAHRWRKRMGGGMRQVGVLAAAGLHALEHHIDRLAEDHASARRLAAGLKGVPFTTAEPPPTNIVMIDLWPDCPVDADGLVAEARARGLLLNAVGPRRLRAVTHLDVTEADCARAAQILGEILDAFGHAHLAADAGSAAG